MQDRAGKPCRSDVVTPGSAERNSVASREEWSDAQRSRDERLYAAAARHYEHEAIAHDTAAARHERRGEPDDASRERTLAVERRARASELVARAAALRSTQASFASALANMWRRREVREWLRRDRGARLPREPRRVSLVRMVRWAWSRTR
jgi:hypothetical protein